MNHSGSGLLLLLAAACVLLPAASGPALAVDQFNVYLDPALPDTYYVGSNATFSVYLDVDSTAKEFNGFDVTMQFIPSVMSVQSAVEGTLFPNECSNRFTPTSQTDSTVSFGDFLLCNGVSANGPGSLVVYTFTAAATGVSPLIITSDPNRSFYDAGLYIWPQNPVYPRQVVFHNAVVKVVNPTSVPPGMTAVPDTRPSLMITPNPIRDSGEIRLRLPSGVPSGRATGESTFATASGPVAVELKIVDSGGRLISRWTETVVGAEGLVIPWRPFGPSGRRLPGGMYFCLLEGGGSTATTRFVVLP